jgi:hypothetical protein
MRVKSGGPKTLPMLRIFCPSRICDRQREKAKEFDVLEQLNDYPYSVLPTSSRRFLNHLSTVAWKDYLFQSPFLSAAQNHN